MRTLSIDSKKFKKINNLDQFFPIDNNGHISFQQFINRADFWMATGSGKTLVIIKLVEILKKSTLTLGKYQERTFLY